MQNEVGAERLTRLDKMLLREQREDGGWAQLPTLASDAYATGLALYALHEGGKIGVDHPAYRRGVEFLLRTQFEDGSWYVASRCFPMVEYTKSGFPHGRSQFISAAATCWATMALTFTVPPAAIHRVLHAGDRPAVTIHAYSPPLTRTGAYRVTPDGALEREALSFEEELRGEPAYS